jgi:hypothetical protein
MDGNDDWLEDLGLFLSLQNEYGRKNDWKNNRRSWTYH